MKTAIVERKKLIAVRVNEKHRALIKKFSRQLKVSEAEIVRQAIEQFSLTKDK